MPRTTKKAIAIHKARAAGRRTVRITRAEEQRKARGVLAAYEVRPDKRTGKWGIYLRAYNVRIATFAEGSSAFIRSLGLIMDYENIMRRPSMIKKAQQMALAVRARKSRPVTKPLADSVVPA